MLTSLKSVSPSAFQWRGGVSADVLEWAPNQPLPSEGACAGILSSGLQSADCDALNHFVCEEKPKTPSTAIILYKQNTLICTKQITLNLGPRRQQYQPQKFQQCKTFT
jgi:hypothetical protein